MVMMMMMMMQATTLYCLVTEYASGGELLAYIKSQKDCRLGESASRPFIRQLMSAIFYLHERGIVHRYVEYTRPSTMRGSTFLIITLEKLV